MAGLIAVSVLIIVSFGLLRILGQDDAARATAPTPISASTPQPYPLSVSTFVPTLASAQPNTPTMSPTAQPVGTPTVINTTTWKTYQNPQYGFQVRYPPAFAYGMPGKIVPNGQWLFNMWFYDTNKSGQTIALVVLGNPQHFASLDAYVKAYLDPTSYLPPPGGTQIHFRSYDNPREISIHGLQALTFVDSPEGVTSPTTLILMPDRSKVIKLYYAARPDFDALASLITATLDVMP